LHLGTGFGVLNAESKSARPYATNISGHLTVDAMFVSMSQLQFLVDRGALLRIHASTTKKRVDTCR
jgi:hypothetical protein